METPDASIIQPLHSIHRSHGDYEDLLLWGNVQYHLLLQFNKTNPNAAENVALESLWLALSADDDRAIQDAEVLCFNILFPFMQADYMLRLQSDVSLRQSVKLQAATRNGVLQAIQHNRQIKYPPNDPIDNEFPDLLVFSASEIETLSEIVWHISKIKLQNSTYCLKSVHRGGGERGLKRELSILPYCSHPNIIRFIGVVEPAVQKQKVDGMIIEYIRNAKSLRDADFITSVQCEEWTTQIRSAIEYLHREGFVWGDAKADNVLIREDGDVVLVDFGGGFTSGWVEQQNSDTSQGDWQGFERIVQFMKSKAQR